VTRRIVLLTVLGGLIVPGLCWCFRVDPRAATVEASRSPQSSYVAANGIVEGRRPEAALRSEIAAPLARVAVREGQAVKRGELLIELRNESQKQQVALARAELAIARADLERLKNGERAEKRKASAAIAQARQTIYQQAESDWKRSRRLAGENSISIEQYQNDGYKLQRTRAEWQQAAADLALVEAPPRIEDVAAAEARVAAAEARLRLAEDDLAKTQLRAPSDGHILQVYAEPGELATPSSSQPLLLLADLSRRRVRAFVEELDVARVRVGQSAVITADGYPGREFHGQVTVVLPRMGKRSPETDRAGEYKDVYYQEVLIALEPSADLPLNLRVQTRIETADGRGDAD
jgi:multidrug resistance efflux pump